MNEYNDDANQDEEEIDEYASAKKLVQRAADREALLSLFKNKKKEDQDNNNDAVDR